MAQANVWKGVSLVLAGVIAGCAAGAAPRAIAQWGPPPAYGQWQIQCEDGRNVERDVDALSSPEGWNWLLAGRGADGWEPFALVANSSGKSINAICFKRPVVGPGAPPHPPMAPPAAAPPAPVVPPDAPAPVAPPPPPSGASVGDPFILQRD